MEETKHGNNCHEVELSAENPLSEEQLSKQDIEISLENTVTKLPLTAKYCKRINLRWIQNQHSNNLGSCFMLNPECQIKILKKSLNKESICNNLQLKNHINFNEMPSLSENTHNNAHDAHETNLMLKNNNESIENTKCQSNPYFSDEIQLNRNININTSVNSKNDTTDTTVAPTLQSKRAWTIKNFEEKLNSISTLEDETPFKSMLENKTVKPLSNHSDLQNDVDNEFEFTIKQENIVSFVCSPNSPKRETKTHKLLANCLNGADSESEKQTKSCPSGEDPWSETVSNGSYKSNCFEKVETSLIDENEILLKQLPIGKSFFFDSPSSSTSSSYIPSIDRSPSYCSVRNGAFESATPKSSFSKQFDCINSMSNDEKYNYETITFRETSLRSCYNMENVLKEVKPPLPEIEKEINDVKRLIFSAIGLKRINCDAIGDSVLSILDICKSWIKLNSHFEQKEFKVALESQGVDLSIVHDFLQWTNVSRMFIDKMTQALSKIVPCSTIFSHLEHKGSTSNSAIEPDFDKTRINLKSLDSSSNNLFDELKMLQKCEKIPFKNHQTQKKNWNQKCVLHDKMQTGDFENKPKRLVKSKFTNNSSHINTFTKGNSMCKNDLLLFQDQNAPISFAQANIEKFNEPFTNKNRQMIQSDIHILGYNKHVQQPLLNGPLCNQNTCLINPVVNSLKAFCNFESEMVYPVVPPLKGMSANSTAPLFSIPNNSSMNVQNMPPVLPNMMSQHCFINPNEIQCNLKNVLKKSNPIYCSDTEHCTKSSYIKPGSYNPPQKPANLQKVVSNSVLIDDSPITGVQFHYSSSQSNSKQNRLLTECQSPSKIQTIGENDCISKSEHAWQAASTSAENFINAMSEIKLEGNLDLSLNGSPSSKSHFLLDEVSCLSSSTNLKQDSEEVKALNNPSPGECTPVAEDEEKITDWLGNLLSNTVIDNRKETEKSLYTEFYSYLSDQISSRRTRTNEDACQQNTEKQNHTNSSNDAKNSSSGYEHINCLNTGLVNHVSIDNLNQNREARNETEKKFEGKNKKIKDDCVTKTDQKPSPPFRKTKPEFKRTISKQVFCKLEYILNCIWNTEFSILLGELGLGKELLLLELKIRRSLYFQAMMSKLSANSYDTLEKALTDFQHNFEDIKNRNKGDKQCFEVVEALEKIFLDLVEKHFGISYQPKLQFFEIFEESSNLKPRKQKRVSRRF